ncbi:MAG: MBL fold metallo-hydrolase [Acidobacteria bacterium]|nr:MAG: MBL fold metallo-hydrolase [Acidobacteriota bacterium]
MAGVTEIAPDVYRISVYATWANLQFNHFLVKDDEPLLFHTGLRGMFPDVREAVSQLMDPSQLRVISFSHFESDECGALQEWLGMAPRAEVVCSDLGAMVSVNDFIGRPARGLADGDTFSTGKYRFRFCRTPHLPHGWDAGVLFEETEQTLLCSDLFHQNGDVEPLTESDVVGRSQQSMREYQAGILAEYVPYTPLTAQNLMKLAELKPRTLAIMHGSSFRGDGAQALHDLNVAFREVFGRMGTAAS